MPRLLTRRSVLTSAAKLSPLVLSPALVACGTPPMPAPGQGGDGRRLFTLGVASGEPLPDGIVLWTRLARQPLQGGGMGQAPVEVAWELAEDDRMQRIVRKGTATARAESAHSVHVEVDGLAPDRWYWYRFHTPDEDSRIGRTRTAPAPDVLPDRLRFAVASCQHYEHGYYTAHRHMAEDDLDLVVWLGDYIYEGRSDPANTRPHGMGSARSLADYRNRYGLYKSDPDLQASHAARPWIVTWDDHEVQNDYAGGGQGPDDARFRARQAAGYQAFYEHMPLRRGAIPAAHTMQLYRGLRFGRLADFNILDTRQYRDPQACDNGRRLDCAEALDPARTILGPTQESWLFERFKRNAARWTVVAQQVPVVERRVRETGVHMDKWDGYVGARDRLFEALGAHRPSNPVVLTGDVHEAWVGDLKADFKDPKSRTLGVEFICTSIASDGNGSIGSDTRRKVMAAGPHLKYVNGKRGYTRCEVTADLWRADLRTVDHVSRPGASIQTAATYVVENGRPGSQKA